MATHQIEIKPIRVSPLIRFARWTLLGLGIMYGMYYQKKFSKIENAYREQMERERPMREAKAREEKRLKEEADMKLLNEIMNQKS